MTRASDEALIEALAADARPVRPLRPPIGRAAATLAAAAVAGLLAVLLAANLDQLRSLHAGREAMLALEMLAALATGVLAVTGAFFAAVPGHSRRWRLAPLPFLAAWLLLSGANCLGLLPGGAAAGRAGGESMHCLLFILGVSVVMAPLLVWNLSRARPIDPLPVALLGGLGAAALGAFLLHFFHPFAVTVPDLGMHFAAVALVIGVGGLLHRRALAPA